jgi:hypothetical protein
MQYYALNREMYCLIVYSMSMPAELQIPKKGE